MVDSEESDKSTLGCIRSTLHLFSHHLSQTKEAKTFCFYDILILQSESDLRFGRERKEIEDFRAMKYNCKMTPKHFISVHFFSKTQLAKKHLFSSTWVDALAESG